MIEKGIKRYSLVDAGGLCRLFRSDGVFKSAGDDFANIANLASFVEIQLRCEQSYILGIDPRFECFSYVPAHSTTCYSAHFVVRKDKRGPEAIKHMAMSAKYLFEHTKCNAIIGYIRESNKPARMAASAVGLRRIGKTEGTMRYNGEHVGEVIYQCTRDDYNKKYGDSLGFVGV